jgi:septum formation protein
MGKDILLLASKSPRRIEMLSKYCELEIFSPDIEEDIAKFLSVEEAVMSIALKKALNVLDKNKFKNTIVLSADTVVYKEEILGKPKDKDEAYLMLEKLSGGIHSVFTGYAIIHSDSNTKIVDYEKTDVEFFKLNKEIINKYLRTEEYNDKAGAYGIQGFGELLVKRISGSYSNVVGLPISAINNYLRDIFKFDLI